MNYLFSKKAHRQQDEIWDYTARKYGEKQADKYLDGLHRHLEKLAQKAIPWRKIKSMPYLSEKIESNVLYSYYGRHYIFFKQISAHQIAVILVLHDAMDIPRQLSHALY